MRPGSPRPAPVPRPLGRSQVRLRCGAGQRARPRRASVRCPVSGVWTRRQVSGGAPGVGVRGRGKGDPDRTAAGHVGGLGAVLGLQAGLHVTQGRVHARQEGSAGEGAGAAGWWRRGRVWAVLQFLDSCRTAPAPRVSPRLPRAPNRPATGTPRRCAGATAPRTSTGTHVGRAVWTSVPDLAGRSGETVSARRHPRCLVGLERARPGPASDPDHGP